MTSIKRGLPACLAALTVLLCFAPVAQAATCGSAGENGAESPSGALTLKPSESTTEINAGRKTSERQLIFVFAVSECTLAPTEEVHAKVRSSDIGPSAFGTAESEVDDSVLVVAIPVKPGSFDPGKHTAVVTVGGPNIATSISKVSLQRTENRWYIPLLICLVAGLVGLAWIAYTVAADVVGAIQLKARYVPLAIGGALIGCLLIYKTNYLDAEIWELDPGSIASLGVAAATAAAGASTIGALTKAIPGGAAPPAPPAAPAAVPAVPVAPAPVPPAGDGPKPA